MQFPEDTLPAALHAFAKICRTQGLAHVRQALNQLLTPSTDMTGATWLLGIMAQVVQTQQYQGQPCKPQHAGEW